jgi:hypothetical protein
MKWEKYGLVYKTESNTDWIENSALQPTPLLLEDRIRVYVGFRDTEGISRVGYVDFSIEKPWLSIGTSKSPCLDIGQDGAFDDNGVVPSAIVKLKDEIRLYYAGYQLVNKVRFLVLCGLAVSKDGGTNFVRYKKTPILERTDTELLFRVIHSIIYDNNKWKVWYGGGDHFINGKNKTLPVYDIRYMESKDGIVFPNEGQSALTNTGDEYRIGRPYVFKYEDHYIMFFGRSTEAEPYRLDYATSVNGEKWIRSQESFGLDYSNEDFDSIMSAYPGVVNIDGKIYMYYNGNEYGRNGIGLAQLIKF